VLLDARPTAQVVQSAKSSCTLIQAFTESDGSSRSFTCSESDPVRHSRLSAIFVSELYDLPGDRCQLQPDLPIAAGTCSVKYLFG